MLFDTTWHDKWTVIRTQCHPLWSSISNFQLRSAMQLILLSTALFKRKKKLEGEREENRDGLLVWQPIVSSVLSLLSYNTPLQSLLLRDSFELFTESNSIRINVQMGEHDRYKAIPNNKIEVHVLFLSALRNIGTTKQTQSQNKPSKVSYSKVG